MDVTQSLPDSYYDWLIADPPYGISADNPNKKNVKVVQKNGSSVNIKSTEYLKKNWDSAPPTKEQFDEMIRVSKNQIIFGINYFGYYEFQDKGGRVVWNKMNGLCDQFGCEIAYNSLNNRTDIVNYLWRGMMQGTGAHEEIKFALKQKGNKKKNEKRLHPTQKPVALYDWFYKKYIPVGAKVLDTHHGVGSNAISAYYHGVSEFTGCEIDSEYFNASVNRIKVETIQNTLF